MSALILISAAALCRLIPHWPNFTPVLGMALFAGLQFGRSITAYGIPLLAMVLSDVALGVVLGTEYAIHSTQLVVYGCVISTVAFGAMFRNTSFATRVFVGGTAAGLGFFIITNAAVWLFGSMYPQNLSGLLMAYEAGLAFYRDGGNFLLNGIVSTWLSLAGLLLAHATFTRTSLRAHGDLTN